jgi:hypothetical protein
MVLPREDLRWSMAFSSVGDIFGSCALGVHDLSGSLSGFSCMLVMLVLGRYETRLQTVNRACNEFLSFFGVDLVNFIPDYLKLERCVTTTEYHSPIMPEDTKRKHC